MAVAAPVDHVVVHQGDAVLVITDDDGGVLKGRHGHHAAV